jgi:hypothetical protein
MPYFVNRSLHWHIRAKEARSVAVSIAEPRAREMMFEVAQAYDRMATRAEKHPITVLSRLQP